MNDEETNEGDTQGEETNSIIEKVSDIDKVTKTFKELKEANDKVAAELLRGEELRAKVAVGGKAAAGQETQAKKESNADYAKRVESGEFNGPKET